MLSIQAYSGSSSSSDEDDTPKDGSEATLEPPRPVSPESTKFSLKKDLQICAAPTVLPPAVDKDTLHIHPDTKELMYNPKFEELFAPVVGPTNPFKSEKDIEKNILSGRSHANIYHLCPSINF